MSDTINYFYIENAYAGSNTVTVHRYGSYKSGQMVASLQYSKDLENWSTIDISATTATNLTLNEGEKVYFRNDNGKFSCGKSNVIFSANQNHNTGGNIMSLLNYNNMVNVQLTSGCFNSLFGNDSKLLSVNIELPATTLANGCYVNMFAECTSLNEVTIYANDISAEYCLNNWLEGVSETGTFNKNGFAVYSRNSSGIPSGWTVVTPFRGYGFNRTNMIDIDYLNEIRIRYNR